MRRRGVRRISQTQSRPAITKFDLIAVEQGNCFGDPLTVNQSPVEALKIGDGELTVTQSNFGVTPGNDRGVGVDHDFALRVAAQPRDFLCQRDSLRLPSPRLFEVEMRGQTPGRLLLLGRSRASRRRRFKIRDAAVMHSLHPSHVTPRRTVFRRRLFDAHYAQNWAAGTKLNTISHAHRHGCRDFFPVHECAES